jgi:hypothetical protein
MDLHPDARTINKEDGTAKTCYRKPDRVGFNDLLCHSRQNRPFRSWNQ